MNLDQYENWLKLHVDSAKTVSDYINNLKRFLKSSDGVVSQESVEKYLGKKLDDGASKNTFNTNMYAIAKYCKFLKRDIEFPKSKTPDTRIKDFVTLKELNDDILPYFPDIFQDHERKKLEMRFMFFTGLRPQEMVNLKIEHLDFVKERVRVVNTKGKVDRSIPFLCKDVFVDLQNHLRGVYNDNVFNTSYAKIHYTFTKTREYLNISKKFEPKTMRISFAKYCWEKGVREKAIQQMMGHKSFDTTSIYLDITDDMIQKECDNIKI